MRISIHASADKCILCEQESLDVHKIFGNGELALCRKCMKLIEGIDASMTKICPTCGGEGNCPDCDEK